MIINKQVNKEPSKLIRIDSEWHRILKIASAKRQGSIKALVGSILADHYEKLMGLGNDE